MDRKKNGGLSRVRYDSNVSVTGSKMLTLECIEMNLTRSASQLMALQDSKSTKHLPDSAAATLVKNQETEQLNPHCDQECDHKLCHTSQTSCLCERGQRGSKVKGVMSRKIELRDKVIKTAILYSGVFILGLQWGVIGPSLPDLELVTGGSTSYISLILTGRNIAALIGSALAGFLIDRYNNWLLLGVSEIFLGVLFAVAPWGHGLVLIGVCMVASGVAAGFYDTGVNVAVLRVWDGRPGPWIQGMECIDAIGSFVAPFIAQPFLAYPVASPWQEEAEFYLNQSTVHSSDLVSNNAGAPEYRNATYTDVTSANNTGHATEGKSRIMFSFLIVGILLVIVAIAHLVVFFYSNAKVKLVKKSSSEDSFRCTKINSNEQFIRKLILPLLFLICFAYYSLETGYAHYLMTFCVKYLHWDKSSGVAVTSAFWGAYTAGTAIGIVLIKFVQPRTLLIFDVVLCLVSQVVLVCFLTSHRAVVWICTIAAGVSIATIFASVFSWAQNNLGVTGKVNALMMAGMSLGEMTSPAVIGILIDKRGAISWVYCVLSSAVLCVVVVIFMLILGAKLKHIININLQTLDVTSSTSGLNDTKINSSSNANGQIRGNAMDDTLCST